jgi:hypothetical protein
MSLAKDRATPYKEGVLVAYPVAGSATIYAGSLVCINTSGYAAPAADTASYLFAGVAMEQADNSSGSDGDVWVRVRRKGIFDFVATSITQGMVGSMMYIKDDQTFDNTSNNLVACGRLVKYTSETRGWIEIEPAARGTYNISVDGRLDVTGNLTLEDGTVLTKFSAAPTPGWAQLSNKERVLKWATHATPTAVGFSAALPDDLDDGSDVEIHYLAAMSDVHDTPVIETEAYFGAGDTDCAGADDEVDGGVTLTEYKVVIDAADVPAGPAALSVVLTPKAGELGTDSLYIYAVWLEYTRKNAA